MGHWRLGCPSRQSTSIRGGRHFRSLSPVVLYRCLTTSRFWCCGRRGGGNALALGTGIELLGLLIGGFAFSGVYCSWEDVKICETVTLCYEMRHRDFVHWVR